MRELASERTSMSICSVYASCSAARFATGWCAGEVEVERRFVPTIRCVPPASPAEQCASYGRTICLRPLLSHAKVLCVHLYAV